MADDNSVSEKSQQDNLVESLMTPGTVIIPPTNPVKPSLKKSPKRGFLLATLITTLLIVPIIVYYVSQPKELADVRTHAQTYPTPGFCDFCTPNRLECTDAGGVQGSGTCLGTGFCCVIPPTLFPTTTPNLTCLITWDCGVPIPTTNPPSAESCGLPIISADETTNNCVDVGCPTSQCVIIRSIKGGCTCGIGVPTATEGPPPPSKTPVPPSITPSPTPAACQSLKVYKDNGTGTFVDITAALQAGTVSVIPGDVIRIAVSPPANATTARVRVTVGLTTTAWMETTTKDTLNQYFYLDYTITSYDHFLIEAETLTGTIWK